MTFPESRRSALQPTQVSKLARSTAVAVMMLSTFATALTVLAQSDKPIIVSIPPDKPKSELSGLADVLIGSLGLTGIIVIAAVLMGAIMAALMFWVRSRAD